MSTAAPLAMAVFVERFAGCDVRLHEKSVDWMVSRMIGNFHAEITPHSQQVITALAASGLVPIEATFGDKAAVLDAALRGKPTYLLQVPQSFSPDRASDAIVAELVELIERLGIEGSDRREEPIALTDRRAGKMVANG
jgi:hypothetical protein